MMFDKFIKVAERSSINEFKRLAKEARLFVFDTPVHKLIADQATQRVIIDSMPSFFLPFKCVAVEDPASCVIIEDIEKDQHGFGVRRRFLECMRFCNSPDVFEDSSREYFSDPRMMDFLRDKNKILIDTGTFTIHNVVDDRFDVEFALGFVGLFDDGRFEVKLTDVELKQPQLQKSAMRNIIAAVKELAYINQPSRFILEERPTKVRHKPRKLLRSHERPRYTLLEPALIRRRMRLPEPEHKRGSPRPHERRAHLRVLRADRYKEQGKVIRVKAAWIGPTENTVGNKKYRVLVHK